MNNRFRHPFTGFCIILLAFFLHIVLVSSITKSSWVTQIGAYGANPPGGGGVAGASQTPEPPACTAVGGCEVVLGLNGAAEPAVGSGYDYNGVHYEVMANADGSTYLNPDPKNEKEGGAGGLYNMTNTPTRIITATSTITPTLDPTITPTATPVPTADTGTVNAVAVYSNNISDLSTCAKLEQLQTNGKFLNNTEFFLNSVNGPNTQIDGTGINFTGVYAGYKWYLTEWYPPGGYSVYTSCVKTNLNPTYLTGDSIYMEKDLVATFIVGFGPMYPWLQTQGGGNVYSNTIISYMPLMFTPTLLFDNTAAPATPGILSSNTGVDFFDSWASPATENISTTNWNTNNAITPKDWYPFFSARLSQAQQTTYTGTGEKPASIVGQSFSVYKTTGDLTINSPWAIGNTEKIVVIVDGTLDIRNTVTITGNGFIAFIVKNNILINSAVGTTWNSTTPVVEGMYIAGDTIKTGLSTAIATERFVGKGMFIAKTILTQRNLLTVGRNRDTSADLFIYNPSFLISMPDILKDLSYTWQEVAP